MKIAIATTFFEFNSQYSLTTVVRDRAFLLSQAGHIVEVWVQEDFRGETFGLDCVPIMPRFLFHDYQDDQLRPEDYENVDKVYSAISERLKTGIDAVFIEDLLFQGWFFVHGVAIRKVAESFPNVRFFSIAHSIPAGFKTIWKPPPPNVILISLNDSIKINVAENYRTTVDRVHTLYNAMDFRTYLHSDWFATHLFTWGELYKADIVQIYPFSSERWRDKGVDKLILIFKWLKSLGNTVKLILVTAWNFPESIKEIRLYASQEGLTDQDVIITSELYPSRQGLPNETVRRLMQISDVFIFPSRAEACPLILLEAMMSGCYIVVNDMLPQLSEIAGSHVLKLHLNDSVFHSHIVQDEQVFYRDVAYIIHSELLKCQVSQTRKRIRKFFSFEFLYQHQYVPLLYGLM